MTNVERFNVIALHLFSKLYDSFPVPVDLDPNDLALEIAERLVEGLEKTAADEVVLDLAEFIGHTVEWLKEEEFLTVRSRNLLGSFYGVRFTNKGLSIMGSPSVFKGQPQSLAERVKAALRDGSKEAIADTAKSILTKAFGLGLDAVSGAIGG